MIQLINYSKNLKKDWTQPKNIINNKLKDRTLKIDLGQALPIRIAKIIAKTKSTNKIKIW